MNQSDTVEEQVTTTDNQVPHTVTKTTREVEPVAKGENPQKVYEKKKTIFRFNQIIWFVLGVVEVLLLFRIVLKALGANQFIGFTSLIYSITSPLVAPFRGILAVTNTGSSTMEWSTILAAGVYLSVAWGFVYFMDLIYPITPKDV